MRGEVERTVGGAFIALFLAALVLPFAQTVRPFLRLEPLAGVEEPLARPRLSWGSWWEGSFQQRFEGWYARWLGLRPALVRTDNQIGLSLFGLTNTGASPVVVGREGWLFERLYVDKYNRGDRYDPAAIDAAVGRLRRLEALLAARGVSLIVVVAPSKAEVYPDYLPPGRLAPGRDERGTFYDYFAPRLGAAGIDVVDAHALFIEERRRGAPQLFPRGGTHWNHYGAALVAQRILQALERSRPGRFVQATVRGTRVDERVWKADADLARLLNVWDNRRFLGPQVHPVLLRDAARRARARLLFVGDSFSLTPIALMAEEGLMEPGDDLYYFSRRIRFPEEVSSAFAREAFDVDRELQGIDAVVLVANEVKVNEMGFGFVQAALAALEAGATGR